MSYLALARKWRPRTFSQLIGQEHVSKALINSLNQNRLHHAYLFTGTRGVGKTSIARLFAKALNCERGITSDPCLQCDACVAIEQGNFIDLIEIDAASKTRVEDTRELLENIQYSTNVGRFKIYLIDEVHMLSQHSFNALLKTLEEPPNHVKFLLATTDPQKLPITVLSRCLQFNLKHLLPDVICQQLKVILNEEKRSFSDDALIILAKAARGSMRDALSILDQVLISTDDSITATAVKTVLGYTQQDFALQLLTAIIENNGPAIIAHSRQIALEGGAFSYVLDELIHYLHQITLYQILPTDSPLLTPSMELQQLAQQISAEETQLFYQIALKGAQDMILAPSLALGFEMTLLRMLAFKLVDNTSSSIPPDRTHEKHKNNTRPQSIAPAEKKIDIKNDPIKVETPKPPLNTISQAAPTENPKQNSEEHWDNILPKLGLTGMARTAAENAVFNSKIDQEVIFDIHPGHQSLFTSTITQRIEQALSHYYQQKIKLTLRSNQANQNSPANKKQTAEKSRQNEAKKNIEDDHFLKELKEKFSAEIIESSISYTKDDL